VSNIYSVTFFNFQDYRGIFKSCDDSDRVQWTEKKQFEVIDRILRSADQCNILSESEFPPITGRLILNTQIYIEVVENVNYFETIQKLLSSRLPIPLSLKDCPMFENYAPAFSGEYKGQKILDTCGLLPDELKYKIWNFKYPVIIR